MAQALVTNNAYSTLAAGISAIATSITVAVGHGSRFPTVSGGNYFYATLIDAANVLEIVKVVGRAGDVLTVTRGQDGTTAAAYLLGDRIELRPTAALFDDKMPKGGGIFTGPIEVPAGAATTQAPQVQEVVKRAGDSMTGSLTLPEIKGVAGVIELPTAHRVEGADAGSFRAPGVVQQVTVTQSGALVTGTAIMPSDDTIPQLTEGVELFSHSHTPLAAGNKLRIEVTAQLSIENSDVAVCMALFKDAGANALAAAYGQSTGDGNAQFKGTVTLVHYMAAADTTPITFSVRAGPGSAATIHMNAVHAGTRAFGGVCASSITVTEIGA
jgi:hypothetical protein